MEFRSLWQQEQEKGSSVSRLEAQIFSIGLHLLLLLLALYLPGALPPAVVAFFSGSPRPPARPQESETPASPLSEPPKRLEIPLKYAYLDPSVRVPNDRSVKENPDAPILSNRNREARQEAPTPPGAKRLSIDPHSSGDNPARVKPDPRRPEGPEVVEPTEGERPGTPIEATGDEETEGREMTARAAGGTDAAGGEESGAGGRGALPGSGQADSLTGIATGGEGPKAPPPGAGAGGRAAAKPGQNGLDAAAMQELARRAGERLRESLRDVQSGELKFTFLNPAYLRSGAVGTMSFDTKDYPWGDYGRLIYVRIGNNWRERVPGLQPFQVGTRGYTCQYFTIERDGAVSRVITVKPSQHPSYTRTASDAIEGSSPLPPLPKGFPGDREGVTYCFFYNMFPGEAE